jgi:asparagine synthase (glutamine-hydrolysing)
MCGITGLWTTPGNDKGQLELMVKKLAHRGPDAEGVWSDVDHGISLGHRRLSILDLSSAGAQPMMSPCDRYVLVFNGEIYNHLALRSEINLTTSRIEWRGRSDTETLVSSIMVFGLVPTLQKLNGMFALAIWDRVDLTLTLARDRFGEKPLYYGWLGKGAERAFVFASELKALRTHSDFTGEISRTALKQFLRFGYVPSPFSIYSGIYKLYPGCLLTLKGSPGTAFEEHMLSQWWSLSKSVCESINNPIEDEGQALKELEECLNAAVESQCNADVPIGAFLSGGVDSSMVTALMQAQSASKVQSFTVGFDEAGYDEALHARAIAKYLGTEHLEMRITSRTAQEVIPLLHEIYDEPFADASQIPSYFICRAARERVSVALSGDAGDELFGGYNRHTLAPLIWAKVDWMSPTIRRQLSKLIRAVPISSWNHLSGVMGVSRFGEKLSKLSDHLAAANDMESFYREIVSQWSNPENLVKDQTKPRSINYDDGHEKKPIFDCFGKSSQRFSCEFSSNTSGSLNALDIMFMDCLTYLPDDILCKLDRAAMSCSLETRIPFLDRRVVEIAWKLPLNMKIRGRVGKWSLRQVLYKYIPQDLVDRPKSGFSVPIGAWLRGPLREWAQGLLLSSRLEREGFLHSAPIEKAWQEHLSGRRDHSARLWTVLTFQAWLESTHPAHR